MLLSFKIQHPWWAIFIMLCVVKHVITNSSNPSSRSLYYLHTSPASWGSARDTCTRYGAHLVNSENADQLSADVFVLENFLSWSQTFSSLSSPVWTGLHTNEVDNTQFWDRCQPVSTDTQNVFDVVMMLQNGVTSCATIDPGDFSMSVHSCNTPLPYICQIDQGECWFLPVDKKSITDPTYLQQQQFQETLEVEDCARKCRGTNVTDDGAECWGFTHWKTTGLCQFHMRTVRHAILQDISSNLVESSQSTAYLKMCTGGSVSSMAPVTVDTATTLMGKSCTGAGSNEKGWEDSLCYCECDLPPAVLVPSQLILTEDERIAQIVQRLLVDPSNTSAAYRRLNSAEDSRTSATSLGTAGLLVLSTIFGAILLLDVRMLVIHVTACLNQRPQELMTSLTNKSSRKELKSSKS